MSEARRLTRALGGRWYGHYGMAMCPAHDNHNTPALSLADGRDGKLLARCHAGCDPVEVLRAINARVPGLSGVSRRCCPKKPGKSSAENLNFALKVWDASYPIRNSVAERYLLKRAICPPFPDTLRFHPAIHHAPSRLTCPCMIARVTVGDGNSQIGIHRTYLSSDACKAMVSPGKMMLGTCGGGAVRLHEGGEGALVICEGIETGLSVRDALCFDDSALRIWAALSTSGVRKLVLPSQTGMLVIAPDGDACGYAAAETLARRATGRGWHVRIMEAPQGRDWNDVARETLRGTSP